MAEAEALPPILSLRGLSRAFGTTVAVRDLSLDVAEGEFVTLLGPSGCGKTTTLRMIAGFERPDAGQVLLRGHDLTRQDARARGFGMVFQNYALFPHLSVYENVAFGLKVRGLGRADAKRRVEEALALVDLDGYGGRRVQQLSGGQQQRVALARALAPEPSVLLLDEPLSNLDASLRERTRTELRSLLKRLSITAVFVTHDQEEAFALSDRIAVMRAGRIEQVDVPEALYDRPETAFVASFLGRANFVPARLVSADGERALCELDGGVRWSADGPAVAAAAAGDDVLLMIRPEAVRLASMGPSRPGAAPLSGLAEDALQGEVVERRFAGARTHYRVRTGRLELEAAAEADLAAIGERVMVRPGEGARIRAFPAAAEVPAGDRAARSPRAAAPRAAPEAAAPRSRPEPA